MKIAVISNQQLILLTLIARPRNSHELRKEYHEIGSREVDRVVLKFEKLDYVECSNGEYIITRKGINITKHQLDESRKPARISKRKTRFNRKKIFCRNKN